MRYLSVLGLSVAICFASNRVSAQGDSDPGFSSVGAMRTAAGLAITDEEYENQKVQLSVGTGFAKGEQDVKLVIPQLEMRIPALEMGYFDVRLPMQATTGDLAHIWGLGDLTVTYTHFIANPEGWSFQFTGGGLFGMGTANQTDGKTRTLPMAYQSSLGSTDVIVGANAMFKQYVTIAAAYQQPVFRYNDNDYIRSTPYNDPLYSNSTYEVGRRLYRNGDVMLRVEGHYGGTRAGISAGPLAIYHLRNDLYMDRQGYYHEIKDSKGFTLNLAGNAFLRFGRYASFKLDVSAGIPVVDRDAIPDGTKRQWLVIPRFTYFFNQRTLLY